jgi:nucleoid DNA-binding protein
VNKQECVDKVHQAAGVEPSKAATTAVTEAVFDSMAEVVKAEQSFRWLGFGTFESCPRAARKGYHPQTGEPINIKASTTVGCRPAAALKEWMGKKSQSKTKAKAKRKSAAQRSWRTSGSRRFARTAVKARRVVPVSARLSFLHTPRLSAGRGLSAPRHSATAVAYRRRHVIRSNEFGRHPHVRHWKSPTGCETLRR